MIFCTLSHPLGGDETGQPLTLLHSQHLQPPKRVSSKAFCLTLLPRIANLAFEQVDEYEVPEVSFRKSCG